MDHTVVITFDQAGRPVALDDGAQRLSSTITVAVGDRICFVSPHGQARATFGKNGSPLEGGLDGSAGPLVIVATEGSFPYNCGVTVALTDGQSKTFGWPASGGEGGTVVVNHDSAE
jgi:hypothetical protein